jgi:hypothetical protein
LVTFSNDSAFGGKSMSSNRRNEPPQDDLLERYSQAKAELPDGLPDAPGSALRERIMQAAREQIYAINTIASRADSMPGSGIKGLENAKKNQINKPPAANDSIWNIKLVASLAVMGLSGLLWLQFEHGTPQEQEAARSAMPSARVATSPTAPALPAPPVAAAQAELSQAPAAAQKTIPTPAPASPTAQSKKSFEPKNPAASSDAAIAPAPSPPSPASAATANANTGSEQLENSRARQQEAAPAIAVPAPSQMERAAPPTDVANKAQASAPTARYATPTARALAPSSDKLFSAIEAKDAAALREALTQGASPNARRSDSNTALHQGVIQRWAEGVRILLDAGASKEAKNSKGHTAADVALELGYADMTELLAMPR